MATRKDRRLSITEDEFTSESEQGAGFCTSCGETQYNCEPDAREYVCESCEEKKVYGYEELTLMGLVDLEAEEEEEELDDDDDDDEV